MIAAFFLVISHPAKKINTQKKLYIASQIPEKFSAWDSRTYDTSDYSDKWHSINELLIRNYFKATPFSFRSPAVNIGFITEFSSDIRQNFSFHFPENCHRAGGNDVEFLKPLQVDLGSGKHLLAKRIFIKGRLASEEKDDKIVTYWIVMDGKQYYRTFFIKLDQMLSGLLTHAKQGILVRIDYQQDFEYSPEGIEKASKVTGDFIKDLYGSLDTEKRRLIFGKELA